MHHYEIVHIKKLLNHLRLQFVNNFHLKSIDFQKIVDFLKNPSLPKEELNKISFMYHYKIIYTKKPLVHL